MGLLGIIFGRHKLSFGIEKFYLRSSHPERSEGSKSLRVADIYGYFASLSMTTSLFIVQLNKPTFKNYKPKQI